VLWAFAALLAYVLPAPVVIKHRATVPNLYKPVFSAAAGGPLRTILNPYFRLWGMDIHAPAPEPAENQQDLK